ncbi:nucleotidyltransferase domain-containing protein [Pseudomonas sp. S75]|uniref:nucleotidyltransferase domain-containing protein n=1 Tax=unclassified Pseudomonas TaxID=196821 RepID=UPI001903D25D|nr:MULTISPECIES: nucleotidyltransferase domain-containing protein [unclassified Pseudomonas]MBJ9977427.1 nucleotidyltransferase domain-containing protein [Pseudomonas sp. S30]MBK0154887.1 nucleotidyltransferase domain-containing protein [Pseudomonas sp. S75]
MNEHDPHPLSDAMRARVLDELQRLEREHEVTVLYACESGSRAWGFASPDSDYDVRFVYVQRPEWYLRVDEPRDVIERPLDDELDVSGWELRKALRLLRGANPSLLEWLGSPLVYRADPQAREGLAALARTFYSPRAVRHHYLAMARKNLRGYLLGDTVRLKKYLYVIRPLLAVRWIDQGLGMPPTAFTTLLARTAHEPELRQAIDRLLERKRQAGEAEHGPRDAVLHAFIEGELARAEGVEVARGERADSQALDRFLCETVWRCATRVPT